MIIGRTTLLFVGGALILAGMLLGLLGTSHRDRTDVLSVHEVTCGSPWFPTFDAAGDAPVCTAITAPRAELATGLVVLGGAVALLGGLTARRTVTA